MLLAPLLQLRQLLLRLLHEHLQVGIGLGPLRQRQLVLLPRIVGTARRVVWS